MPDSKAFVCENITLKKQCTRKFMYQMENNSKFLCLYGQNKTTTVARLSFARINYSNTHKHQSQISRKENKQNDNSNNTNNKIGN